MKPDIDTSRIDRLLPFVRKPSRYCGNEFNVVRKDWDRARFRMALVFPDLYEIGMSHQGLQILYHIVNSHDGFLAERAYAPEPDFEHLLRNKKEPLFSLESRIPLADFDVIGITLPYELCYSNILTILDLARIPFWSKDRDDTFPLVLGGGSCAFNPEPVADFFDAILLGDGEEAVIEIASLIADAKQAKTTRGELLARIADIKGVYVPRAFIPLYGSGGEFRGIEPAGAGCKQVRRRILPVLENHLDRFPPLVSLTRIIHDRLGVEIARGCTRGCRFCQAGFVNRPVRERSPEDVIRLARAGIELGGFEELALLSLSTGDYQCLPDVLVRLMDVFSGRHISISMPSMRVGTLTPEIMSQIRRVRKTGFTLAPEAGTDRLRRVINKGITEKDLLDTCRAAFGFGWRLIKLYFMFGLPTETTEDLEAIPLLARKAAQKGGKTGLKINVSVAAFVPKPHTPFQWKRQVSVEEGILNIKLLKERLRGKAFNLKWHDPKQSFLEGVMSRGDRRLSRVIEEAWRTGARLDAWTDHFQLGTWMLAAESCSIDLNTYLNGHTPGDPLPWQHLNPGVDQTFLKEECDRAAREAYTPDCRIHGCQGCGLCDFKTVLPVVNHSGPEGKNRVEYLETRPGESDAIPAPAGFHDSSRQTAKGRPRFVYRFTYSKTDEARFLSHLEMIQVFFRAFRRAEIPLNFSHGFNPTPRVSFSPALPLGTESVSEYLIADMSAPVTDPAGLIHSMNRQLPSGLVITGITEGRQNAGMSGRLEVCYDIDLNNKRLSASDIDKFLACGSFLVSKEIKGKMKRIDAREMVSGLALSEDGKIRLILSSQPGKAELKPMELMTEAFTLSAEQARTARVLKVWAKDVPCSMS